MPPKLFIATKAFILHQGKILIVREAPTYATGTQIGKYDVVGGRLQAGEHFDDGLKREAREEVGLEIEVGSPFFVNESWPTINGEQHQIVRVFFRCTAKTTAVQLSHDHDDFQWIEPHYYFQYPIIENLIPAFQSLITKR
ncbi:MAG: NUDIX domain-containing protein [Candidatus Kerfeldbacteria bacterium]|nr:NUDIX domain-containing protein [Candidatus Kerfeldbacteria bacterium]